jgi:sodium transport system permease protein
VNWNIILAVYLKELKDSLRDRRTLLTILVIPTVLMPLLFLIGGGIALQIIKNAHNDVTSMMIVGGNNAPSVVAALKAEKRFKVVEPSANYKQLIADKKIRLAVEIPPGFEQAIQTGAPTTVSIYHYEGELKSAMGVAEVDRFFLQLREKTVTKRIVARGLPANLVTPFAIERQNVAPPEKVGGNMIGGLVPYMLILLSLTGAKSSAMDLTVGEKEHGTMETLLCSPVRRVNIVLGKFLMVVTASMASIVLSLVSSIFSILVGGHSLASGGKFAMAAQASKAGGAIPVVDPLGVLGVFAMAIPIAMFFSAFLMAVSLFAKSKKEAQTYTSPLLIVILIPTMIGMLPGVELSSKTALVPVLNLSLVCKEMLSGVWHWDYIALIFLSTSFFAAISLAICVQLFNRESVMFRT